MLLDNYLHEQKDFRDLIQVVAGERRILPQLIEKDYWIMHVLYGLAKQGFLNRANLPLMVRQAHHERKIKQLRS